MDKVIHITANWLAQLWDVKEATTIRKEQGEPCVVAVLCKFHNIV